MQADSHRAQLLEAGLAYRRTGLSIIPVGQDKKPLCTWKQYQQRAMDEKKLRYYLTKPAATGLAAICGQVSGNLLILDFDVPRFYEIWRKEVGMLVDGLPVQKTGEGYQVALRCD